MPVHRVFVEDHESPAQALERGVTEVEARNEHVVSVQATGSEWVLITGRKAGRPKETRVTARETR